MRAAATAALRRYTSRSHNSECDLHSPSQSTGRGSSSRNVRREGVSCKWWPATAEDAQEEIGGTQREREPYWFRFDAGEDVKATDQIRLTHEGRERRFDVRRVKGPSPDQHALHVFTTEVT